MSEWKEYKLGDICDITSSKRIFYSEYVSDGVPFYRSKEIIDLHNRRAISTELYISKERYEEIKTKFGAPEIGDILLTSVGSLGIPYKVKVGDRFYFKDGNLTWFRNINQKVLSVDFLIHWIGSSIGIQKLDEVTIGSTQPALTISGLKTVDILLPTIEEQERIAGILSSLDDKIDLLTHQNRTLESMAETLFREYFIENSKEEWEEKSLFDCIKLVGGGTPKTSIETYWDGDICWLSGGDISDNHKGYITQSEKTISTEGLSNSSAKLLPTNATVISARGTVGKYCLLSKPMAFSQSNYGVLPQYSNCYYFTFLLIAYSVSELQAAAYGSVFDTITTNSFKSLTLYLPDDKDIYSFELLIQPYFDKIRNNTLQIRNLTKLRDTLLAKLMNNEIKI